MASRRWIITLFALVLLIGGLAGYKVLQIKEKIAFAESFPEPSETVQAETMAPLPWTDQLVVTGELVAPQRMTVMNEVQGQVVQIGFEPGGLVKKGQLLVKLDASVEEAELKAAEAEIELAQLALQRYQKLLSQNASSRDQYDQARLQLAIAQARKQTLQAQIDKKTLTAPFDAQASLHTLHIGQNLNANSDITELVGLQGSLWVDFRLPQQQLALIPNASLSIRADGMLSAPLPAKLIASAASISSQSRNLSLRAELNPGQSGLKPGALVEVVLARTLNPNALSVSSQAVQYDHNGSFVYVLIKPEGKDELRAQKRPVKTGPQRDQRILVESGLQAGELVATQGAYKLQDQMLTHVESRPATASSTAAR